MKIPENRWLRAAVPALLIHCSIGSVYCWSSFSAELSQRLGVSQSAAGWAFSLAIFFLGMSAAFAGRFVERDIHRASLLSCILFTLGMLGTGMCAALAPRIGPAASLAGLFIFYGCIMGVGLGLGYLCPVKTLMLWFSESRGLATGISIMGFGLAKAIASPIMNSLVRSTGLSGMFFILGGVYFVMTLAGHLLLKKPGDWHEEPDSRISLREMLKSQVFVGCWLMFYLNISCGLALISCEKSMLLTAGLSAAAISLVQALTAASNAAGRLAFSAVSDRLRDRSTVYLIIFISSCAVCVAGYALRAVSGGLAVLTAALLIIVNAGYGGGFSTMPALLSVHFGMRNISSIYGLILSAWAVAGLTGNQLSAIILARTGRLEIVLAVLAALYLAALVVCRSMVRPQKQ